MQETLNNCFGLKVRSMMLRQANTGKHECRNVTATLLLHFSTRAYLCTPDEGSYYVFLTRNNCCELRILWCYYSKCYSIMRFLSKALAWRIFILGLLCFSPRTWKHIKISYYYKGALLFEKVSITCLIQDCLPRQWLK